jgi:predicted AAA+ superfamily ATPase
MERYIRKGIERDLQEKMVFLGGPRQVGKSTIGFQLLSGQTFCADHPGYLNWDFPESKIKILAHQLPVSQSLIVLDEIHKYAQWRNLIKGFYDQYRQSVQFLITGSARLDYYRRGGDSLQGRYHYWRLHPICMDEILEFSLPCNLDDLLKFGGFPEPFSKHDDIHWSRWQKERLSRVVQDDLVSLESVRDVSQLDTLMQLLRSRIGSILSVNNLRAELGVAFETAERYLTIFENLYYCYRLSPYRFSQKTSVKKEKKVYLWDWSLCTEEGARFENLVAGQLLKLCHYYQDSRGANLELSFLRDHSGRELDFVLVLDGLPIMAIECKISSRGLSDQIKFFAVKTTIPAFYQVHISGEEFQNQEFRASVLNFSTFVRMLSQQLQEKFPGDSVATK